MRMRLLFCVCERKTHVTKVVVFDERAVRRTMIRNRSAITTLVAVLDELTLGWRASACKALDGEEHHCSRDDEEKHLEVGKGALHHDIIPQSLPVCTPHERP